MRILLVEDEPELAHWLTRSLRRQSGFTVEWANDGLLAYKRLQLEEFDAVILDLGLPGLNGQTLLERLRGEDNRTPILILTARDSLAERVGTLESGADDFLPKPFMIEELSARLNALIRRSRGKDKPRMSCASLHYDLSNHRFHLNDKLLQITPRENEVLRILIQRSGDPVQKKHILERLSEHGDEEISIDAIEVLIHRLRKKLQNSDVQITTLRGIGYCLEPVPADDTN
jgi:two-component system response regulator TctD